MFPDLMRKKTIAATSFYCGKVHDKFAFVFEMRSPPIGCMS